MPSRGAALIVDLEGGASSQLSWIRSSYYLSTVVPDSRRITYGGDSCVLLMETPQILVLVILELEYS